MPAFSKRSKDNLSTCHIQLQELFNEVIKHRDCTVLEGHRGEKAQEEAFKSGSSRARFGQSMHNRLPSLAADVVPYPVDWSNTSEFYEFAGFVLGVAQQMGITIRWGGHFKSFFDGPHFELKGIK